MARVSGPRNSTDGQVKEAFRVAKSYGIRVRKIFRSAESGTTLDRPGLRKAVAYAQRTGLPILIFDPSRLCRNADPESKQRKRERNGYNFANDQRFKDHTAETVESANAFIKASGVRFISVIDPNAPASNWLPSQTRRGMKQSSNRPGPKKRRANPETQAEVLSLRLRGQSFRKIGQAFSMSAATVQTYCRELAGKIRQLNAAGLLVAKIVEEVKAPRAIVRRVLGKWTGSRPVAIQDVLRCRVETLKKSVVIKYNSYFSQRKTIEVCKVFYFVPFYQRE